MNHMEDTIFLKVAWKTRFKQDTNVGSYTNGTVYAKSCLRK